MKRILLAALAALLIAGCGTLGNTPAADTVNKKAVAAQLTITAVSNTAATLRAVGRLNDADRDAVVAKLRRAESDIALAQVLAKTDPLGGASMLDKSIAVLTELQNYLLTKEK